MNKIGIIGLGYWGNIILRNLEKLGEEDIVICDTLIKNKSINQKYTYFNNYKDIECEYVFITTPSTTHFEICNYFLSKGVKVFCEKPLTLILEESEKLYELASKNNTIIFTDWIFTFNSHIRQVKNDYNSGKLGEIKSIFMNRLNLGPERFDVNARWDLASHDVSIIQYLFSEFPKKVSWKDYKRNKNSKMDDSTLGLLEFESFTACLNVSWYYPKKVRECVFEFENFLLTWDDFKRVLEYEEASKITFPIYSGNINYPCSSYQESLVSSINSFFSFSEKEMKEQQKITLETIKILNL
ncbi:MAG: Gfo/Idh/MocA family oxidoreductase [Candidatus Lokiarchaeota archaeon]|nr:Gfo/Idh/MocA family oxidoreductase [Candidatus Lokiarchaeota archaeon]